MKISNELFITPHRECVEISCDGDSVMIAYPVMQTLCDALQRIINTAEEDYLQELSNATRDSGAWEQLLENPEDESFDRW